MMISYIYGNGQISWIINFKHSNDSLDSKYKSIKWTNVFYYYKVNSFNLLSNIAFNNRNESLINCSSVDVIVDKHCIAF